jgi:hypothetical protein
VWGPWLSSLLALALSLPRMGRESFVLKFDLTTVMARLVPAIHDLTLWPREGVDARDKPGHDDCK